MDVLAQLMQNWSSGASKDPALAAAELLFTMLLMFTIGLTYQRTHVGALYTQGFVQSLVMVGMIASLILQIVGANIAAAFAIFGAFSIIRYRSAVPETRDVAFIFFAMAIGLASGAGLLKLATVATLVICATIVVMTRYDLFAPLRLSHILRVRVTNDVDYAEAFRPAFVRYFDRAYLQRIESVQGGMLTEITYEVLLKEDADPRGLVADLQQVTGANRVLLLAAGPLVDSD